MIIRNRTAAAAAKTKNKNGDGLLLPLILKPPSWLATATATRQQRSAYSSSSSSPSISSSFRIFGIMVMIVWLTVPIYLTYSLSSSRLDNETIVSLFDTGANRGRSVTASSSVVIPANNNSSISLPDAAAAPPTLTPLKWPIDYEKYTVRINSWKRTEQLQVVVEHYQTCRSSIAQIQIVWCTSQGPPPDWLLQLSRNNNSATNSTSSPDVVLELHEINSLNERFNVLGDKPPPTAAVLSVDDDVMRPCLALENGFAKWARNPHRIVGYDARMIGNGDNTDWTYGYLSTTQKTNQYSLTLTRFCFIHQDYMKSYFTHMPSMIRQRVHDKLNCEDIALSLWVTSLTQMQVPLLADCWAMQSMVKLFAPDTISGSSGHKKTRDACVQDFAQWLGIKQPENNVSLLKPKVFVGNDHWFDCGDAEEEESANNIRLLVNEEHLSKSKIQNQQAAVVQHWKGKDAHKNRGNELTRLKSYMAMNAFQKGLLKDTEPWRKRFQQQQQQQQQER